MSSPADIDLDALPADVRMLIESERAARAELEQQVATLARHNERLAHLVQEFRKALYGKRSEKLSADERQLAFEDLETALATAEATKEAADATTPAAGHDARAPVRRNLGRLPKELPRIEEVIEPASTCCPCGGEMTRIGEERTERLDIVPAQFRVIATVRPKYACRVCSGAVVQAPAPAHLIEGALPTEGLVAHVLVAKYADHLPLYR